MSRQREVISALKAIIEARLLIERELPVVWRSEGFPDGSTSLGYFLFGIGNSPYAYVVRLPMEWWDDVGGIFMIETRIRAPHFDVLYARLEARD